MKLKLMLLTGVIGLLFNLNAQNLTQTIKGKIIDAQTTYSLPGANVLVQNSNPLIGTTTDMDGYFKLEKVPIGRQNIMVTFLGYKPAVITNILVNSAKEVYVEIKLEEAVHQIEETVVNGSAGKEETRNEMALISSRSFTVDEAMRYAGSLNDPARMAQNYAGVSGSDDMRNDIIVRGNTPNGILYKLEGVNIPSPNHLGITGSSGGYYSMLSQNTLANSDFFTGAFPAEYGNALSGVFDINLRKGNNEKREYAFTFGLTGIEATAEGPFSKNSKASYLINYRYSTLGAFDLIGVDLGAPAVPNFQDLTIKAHIPLKSGYIKVFGLGGNANIDLKDSEVEDPEDFWDIAKPSNIYSETKMAIVGASHKYFFNKNTFGELTISTNLTGEIYKKDTLANPDFKHATRVEEGNFEETTHSIQYIISKKVNAKNKLTAGIQAEYINLLFKEEKALSNENETHFDGDTKRYNAHFQWLHKITNELSFTLGTHAKFFGLTESISIEPRTSIKWNINTKHSVNAGYGLHSQSLLPMYAYFIEQDLGNASTYHKYKNVEPSKSNHFILGYNYHINKNLRFKFDAYYQAIYNVPVEKNSSYWSGINVGGEYDGFPEDLDELVNEGTGENMGIELTLERFLNNGLYYLFTTAIFDSKYKGSDGIKRNSAFNSNYSANFLIGKEFNVGKSKQNSIGIDFRTTLMGGKRYIPINYSTSEANQKIIYNYDEAYENKYADYFKMDLKFSYNINKPKVTHQFVFDLQNITNQQNLYKENYNLASGDFSKRYQQGFMPNIQYRILF